MFRCRTTPIYSSAIRGTNNVHVSTTLSMCLAVTIRIIPKCYCLPEEPHYSETQDPPKDPVITDLDVTTHWHKNNDELIEGIHSDSAKGHQIVLLDHRGKILTDEKFTVNMDNWLECGKNRLTFVIGGSYGLPEELKSTYGSQLLSLSSREVFNPDYTRTLLMERIYQISKIRNEIRKGYRPNVNYYDFWYHRYR
jgi:23S rRNA pseudoU1915 N3-methylase RlmH